MIDSTQEKVVNEFKIPVDSCYPSSYWIVCLDRNSEMPTKEELIQIRSFIEFIIKRTYVISYQKKLLAMPLALENGHNTLVLCKGIHYSAHCWVFRRSTWQIGPIFVPHFTEPDFHVYTLIEILDRNETVYSSKWSLWKNSNTAIFPTNTTSSA